MKRIEDDLKKSVRAKKLESSIFEITLGWGESKSPRAPMLGLTILSS